MSFLDAIEDTRASKSSAILTTNSSLRYEEEDTEILELEKFVKGFSNRFGELKNAVNAIATTRDSESNREKIDSSFKACQNMVSQGKNIVKSLSASSSSKPKAEKLENDFLKITQQFMTLSKSLPERLKLPIPQKAKKTSTYSDGTLEERQSLLDQRRADLQRIEIERENNARIAAEREEQIKKIEEGAVQINEMFKDVAALVEEQGITIDTIDNNITNAETKVGEGVKEIEQAHTYQKKSRKKLLFILGIISAILIFITIVIVVKVTKK